MAHDLKGRRCVLDGEIVCLDSDDKPQFRDLLFRRAEPLFYAFDILWREHAGSDDEEERRRFRSGEEFRYLPLTDRKLRLHAVAPKESERLLYCDHIDGNGEGLFRVVCEHDLEGIVAKRKSDPYLLEHASGLKIRNREYSQWLGREKLFERDHRSDPDCGTGALWRANQISRRKREHRALALTSRASRLIQSNASTRLE